MIRKQITAFGVNRLTYDDIFASIKCEKTHCGNLNHRLVRPNFEIVWGFPTIEMTFTVNPLY